MPDEILGARFNYVSVDPCIKRDPNDCSNRVISENKDGKGSIIEKKEENNDIPYSTVENKNALCKSIITHDSTIMDFLMNIFGKLIKQAGTEFKQNRIPYEIVCDTMYMEFNSFKLSVSSQSYRKDMVDCGVEHAKQFLAKHSKDVIKEGKKGKEGKDGKGNGSDSPDSPDNSCSNDIINHELLITKVNDL